jgi:CheY-like chemotaxis protein
MNKVNLVIWNPEESEDRAEELRAAGFLVDTTVPNGPPYLRRLTDDPPAAVIIDLSRLPSHGREVAMSIRMRKSTRMIPLIFIGGEIQKVDRIRALLPDASYIQWNDLLTVLRKADSSSLLVEEVVVPGSIFDAYSGTPLPKKLGIKGGSKVGLVNQPEGFIDTLGEIPDAVTFIHGSHPDCEIVIWFVRTNQELQNDIQEMAAILGRGSMWIAWPKKTSPFASDLDQVKVREAGLMNNLVDYKICAIDDTWSALLFTHRK